MSLPEFVASYWKSSPEGELLVGGLTVSSLAARHGTPLFIYDRNVVERKYAALRSALPKRFCLSYSVKANPNPTLLRFFLEKGCGLEIASKGEFYQARNAGCSSENIVFAGPGKSQAELETVIAARIREIHAESELEIERISAISEKLAIRTPVAVRVNPNEDSQGGAMRMGGKPAPFGVDEENLGPVLDRVANDAWLDFRGIHLFVGTQILDDEILLMQYEKGLEIARRAAAHVHTPAHTVDFGGGLGIPYFAGDSELDLGRLGQASATSWHRSKKKMFFGKLSSWLSLVVFWSAKRACTFHASMTLKRRGPGST